MAIVTLQRRMMELGRVRMGEKGAKGQPVKRDSFRFTTASKILAEALAAAYGGTAVPWVGAPDEGYFEVKSDATEIDIILPPVFDGADGHPTTSYSQFFELWSGGGCQRRCDGVNEAISAKPCLCNPEARQCKVTTRVSFMIPSIPGLGVWRLESHGMNAAIELPGTLEVLMMAASEHKFIPAVLRIEHRTKKVPGEGTRRYIVPVIDLPHVTVNQLAAGDVPLALNPPVSKPIARPALPAAAPAPPADPSFQRDDDDSPGWGTRPDPSAGAAASGTPATLAQDEAPSSDAPAEDPPKRATAPQRKKLNVLVGTLRDGGHITTEQVYRACGEDPAQSLDEKGELHWSPLRDRLTFDVAHALIDRLETFENNLPAAEPESPFKAPVLRDEGVA